jgi:hypothetical protein
MKNRWKAQIYFAAFAAWFFNALLYFGWHHRAVAGISLLVALGWLWLGVYTFRKPDDPDEPPTRGHGGLCIA